MPWYYLAVLHVVCMCIVDVYERLFVIAAAGIQASQYDEQFVLLFTTTLTQLKQVDEIHFD